jgi:hypothetical protein
MANAKKNIFMKNKNVFYGEENSPNKEAQSLKVKFILQKLLAKTLYFSHILNHFSGGPPSPHSNIPREFLKNLGNIRISFKNLMRKNLPEENKKEESTGIFSKSSRQKKTPKYPGPQIPGFSEIPEDLENSSSNELLKEGNIVVKKTTNELAPSQKPENQKPSEKEKCALEKVANEKVASEKAADKKAVIEKAVYEKELREKIEMANRLSENAAIKKTERECSDQEI